MIHRTALHLPARLFAAAALMLATASAPVPGDPGHLRSVDTRAEPSVRTLAPATPHLLTGTALTVSGAPASIATGRDAGPSPPARLIPASWQDGAAGARRDVARPRVAATAPAARPSTPFGLPLARVEVVRRHPHDPRAFTQGLLWHGGRLYESLGQPGESEVRRVVLETGAVEARGAIPPDQFGEGLTLSRGELVSLTWLHGIGYRWDPRTLRRTGRFGYTGEGWGLAAHGGRLILSDGSATLRLLDPRDFRETGRIAVTAAGRPLPALNELEIVRGELWANIFQTGYIARIDPDSGVVRGFVDLRPLVAEIGSRDREAVANGIAWDAAADRIFVTGKRWPTLFEIRLRDEAPRG